MSFFESILGIDVNQAIALDILATANVLNVTRVLNILGISGNLNVKWYSYVSELPRLSSIFQKY